MAEIDLESPGSDEAALRAALQAILGCWRVLGKSAVAVPHTGNTSEVVLATISIPAGALGPNGQLRIWPVFTHTNSSNTKTMRVRMGGLAGTLIATDTVTTTATTIRQKNIQNRNSASSQLAPPTNSTSVNTATSSGMTTASFDTSAAFDLVLTGQLANSGETITLESYLVEVIYGA